MTGARRDDAVLVAAFRAGGDAAFDAIVERYRKPLVRFARRMLRGAGDDLAQDVVQEALWRAHRALRRDDRAMNLRPWLYRLVRNCALDEIGRVHVDSIDVAGAGLPADPRDEPDAAVERRDDLRRLLGDVARLPEGQRHALVRRELDGLSHAQVAAEMRVTPLAVRSLVHRARAGLARAAEAQGPICAAVRGDLLAAHDERRRPTARTVRHLAACAACRDLRGALRAQRRALGVLAPPGLLLLAAGGVKLALAGKATSVKVALGTTAVVAGAGLGVQTFAAGDPAPVGLRSRALPAGGIARSAPLPRGVAIVQRTAPVRARAVGLRCPPGMRVADLVAPRGGRVSVAYAPGVVAAPTVRAARATHRIGAARADLRVRPRERALAGTVRRDQPVRVTAERPGWRRVVTDDGQTGWLPVGALR